MSLCFGRELSDDIPPDSQFLHVLHTKFPLNNTGVRAIDPEGNCSLCRNFFAVACSRAIPALFGIHLYDPRLRRGFAGKDSNICLDIWHGGENGAPVFSNLSEA